MDSPVNPSDNTSTELLFKPKQLRELIRGVPWLGELADDEITALLQESELQTLKARDWLFRQDAPAHWFYIVINGVVRLARSAGDDRLATIRCVERGGTLGELSMVSATGVYLYSAEALRRTHVLAIPAQHCRDLMDQQPQCRAEFMSRLALELTERLEDLALLTQADAMSRLVSYILRQLPGGRSKTPRVVRLSIPKRWLASQLAMTPETLSRLLARLRDKDIISIDRQRLTVLDEQKLREEMLTDD